jgi:hypothetical protein
MGIRAVAPIRVEYRGDRTAEGPLTLGQHNILRWLITAPDHRHAGLAWTFHIPSGTGIPDVVATVAVLLGRHEGLRTEFHLVDRARQRVSRDGVVSLDVFAVHLSRPGDAESLPDQLIAALRVEVVTDPVRGHQIVAYLAASPAPASPEWAHEKCLAQLRGRVTAMTPHRYVVCDTAGRTPIDHGDWRAMPVLADGPGR